MLALAGAGSTAIGLAKYAGVVGRGGLAESVHVAAATVLLFTITGAAPTRLLLPERMRDHELLWILPVGAVMACLELAVLAYGFVPFDIALGIVIVANIALTVYAYRHKPGLLRARSAEHEHSPSWRVLVVPLYLAALIGAIALLPMFRAGFVTVIGNGSDAHLAVGTGQFLQKHHPGEIAPQEPVDRVPLVWNSKPPIYLTFGAVARIAGMEPYAVIATLAAALLAIAALGFWLLARELLGAGAWAAGAAMGLVGLNRIELFTAMHPYFNQTWGYMAMPFAIVLGWHVVRRRTWGGLILLAAFLAVLAFAYPLALPIPLMSVLVFAGFDRRRRGLPVIPRPHLKSKRQLIWMLPIAALLFAGPVQGVSEKIGAARSVLTGNESLANWGGDILGFFPERFFVGIEDVGMAAIGIPLLVFGMFKAFRHAPSEVRWGLGAVVAFGIFAAFFFRPREYGWYFHFKALAFTAPLIVVAGAVGLSQLRRKWVAVVALLFLVGAVRNGAASEIGATFDQLPKSMLALKQVDARLRDGESVRLDMPPDGRMLWAGSMLSGQPLCSQRPLLKTSYPHVPVSRAADYVLVDKDLRKPFDAVGAPELDLERYRLYRLRPGLPGGDRCSRRMVQTVTRLQ